jgi:hypothetical protein
MNIIDIRWILASIIIAAGIMLGISAHGGRLDLPAQNSPNSPLAIARALVADINYDGYPDFVLQNASTHQTAIWYLENNFYMGGVYGSTLRAGWELKGVADLNWDSHPDYVLFNPNTRQTAIWYLDYSGDNWYFPQPTFIGSAYGPTLPRGWELVATGGFDWTGLTDYVLCNPGTRQTAVWYLNNNVFVRGAYGPTLSAGWGVAGMVQYFYGEKDCALFNPITGQTVIAYLEGTTLIWSAYGPMVPRGWALVALADFDGDGYSDYLLYNASTRQTAIWYLYNNILLGGAYGPTIPVGWSLVAP